MKLFVSDLDGTLLGDDHCISPVNLTAVGELEQAGVTFAVATGRAYEDAVTILTRHGLRSPIICSNGACVYSREGELLHKTALPLPALRSLCRFMDERNIFFAINSPLAIHVLHGWENILHSEVTYANRERLRENKDIFFSQFGIVYTDSFDDFLEGRTDSCSLSVISLDSDKLRALADFIAADGSVILTVSGFDSLEILCKGSTKADALRWLTGQMGIAMEQVCAIGDNYNDLDMLRAAGVSFAMGNAPDDIKKSTTYVTEANYCDGVARAVRKLLYGGNNDDFRV